MKDYPFYVSSLPSSARPYLVRELDWDHEGMDRDLNEISYYLVDWEVKLTTHLELTAIDIAHIKYVYQRPILQRSGMYVAMGLTL